MSSAPEKPRTKANRFVIRLAEGMAGWASYAQAAKKSPIYSESLIYLPIFELAKGRKWKARPQKRLVKKIANQGRNKTVDFVFQSEDGEIGIFLEAKFIRHSATHCVQVTKDIHKLISLTPNDISERRPPAHIYRYVLVMGRESDIKSRIRCRAKELVNFTLPQLKTHEDRRLLGQIDVVLKSEERRSASTHGWAFHGLGAPRWRYWAVLLSQRPWWDSLSRLGQLTNEPDEDEEEADADDLAGIESDVQDEET